MDAQCYPDFAGEKYPQCPYRAEAGQHCQDSADPFMYKITTRDATYITPPEPIIATAKWWLGHEIAFLG